MACIEEYRKSRSESIGSYDAYRVPSSVDLLRASIVRSIRERAYENQGFLERKFDGSESKPAQYCGPKYSVVEVSSPHSLEDGESDLSDSERKDTINDRKADLLERTNSSETSIALSSASDELEDSLSTKSGNSSIRVSNEDESSEDWLVIKDKKEDSKDQKSIEMNNFILARRKFNNSIFQDCSTYDITCPTVHLNEVKDKCSQLSDFQNPSAYIHPSSPIDSISVCSNEDCSPFCSNEENSTIEQRSLANIDGNVDDHTTLCDTFFTYVVGDEPSTPTNQSATDGRSSLVEKDINSVESIDNEGVDNEVQSVLPAKRKFSRRHRKRSKRRTKSKKSYVYECTKCGVSYFIPTKAMNNVACCLHCDLWTPVEPVFVKREKTMWNTCRIS